MSLTSITARCEQVPLPQTKFLLVEAHEVPLEFNMRMDWRRGREWSVVRWKNVSVALASGTARRGTSVAHRLS